MSVTTEQLTALKKQISDIRDKGIKARATMEEVERNIEYLKDELLSLGISDVDKAENEIFEMENEVEKLYSDIKNKLDKYM